MQVTADSAFTAVHKCQMLDVAKGAELSGDIAAYLLRTGAAVSPADDDAKQVAADIANPATGDASGEVTGEAQTDELDITGTIDQVLAWVGDDPSTRPDRALVALEAEQARLDKARTTLLAQLTEIVEN
jgi:hypothetical protein